MKRTDKLLGYFTRPWNVLLLIVLLLLLDSSTLMCTTLLILVLLTFSFILDDRDDV